MPMWTNSRRAGLRCVPVLMVLCAGLLPGCMTMDVPPDKIKPLSAYPVKLEQQGLTIAVNALNRKEIDEVFGTDLLDDGILPVLVVAENRSPSTSFVLPKNKVAVADAKAVPSGKVEGVGQTKEAVGGTISAAGVILMSPLALLGTKLSSDAGVVMHGLGLKEFQSHTVDPGQTVHGYVYFPYPKGAGDKPMELRAVIEVTETSNFRPLTFDLPIKYSIK